MAGRGTPLMNTPLTIAMPKPMADALGYPQKPIGWADILTLTKDPQGWATYGHPEWGPFRLGKTNPNFSTSGLSALIAQNYAAAGKTRRLLRKRILSGQRLTVREIDDVNRFASFYEANLDGAESYFDLSLLPPAFVAARTRQQCKIVTAVDAGGVAHAKVFFSLLVGDPVQTAEGLNQAAGFLRTGLFKRLHIHTVPTLHFHFDRTTERAADMNALIAKAVASKAKDD